MPEFTAASQFKLDASRLLPVYAELLEVLAAQGVEWVQIDEPLLVGGLGRDAIKRIGGTLPENIPADEHIKEVEKRLKGATPKLELDEREAGGLLGDGRAKPAKWPLAALAPSRQHGLFRPAHSHASAPPV